MKIFIDVSPGFYKTKLFSELSKEIDILVVYTTDYDSSSRNNDFLGGDRNYPYIKLHGSKIKQAFQIFKLLCVTNYDEVISGGYTSLAAWIPFIFFCKKKNAIIIESTFRETKTKGKSAFLKRILFSRVKRAYVCGTPHEKLTRMFGFRGEVIHFNSVGLFNVIEQPKYQPRSKVENFLFVGRLIYVKNLEWLIDRFENHPELNLSIIGFGELENKIRNRIRNIKNIELVGAVNNKDLSSYYQQADVFILPSITETWGLVVEEALNNGTPIMCSHMVGSADDLVVKLKTGVTFEMNQIQDFEQKLVEICNPNIYNKMRERISLLDFFERERQVVESFKK